MRSLGWFAKQVCTYLTSHLASPEEQQVADGELRRDGRDLAWKEREAKERAA